MTRASSAALIAPLVAAALLTTACGTSAADSRGTGAVDQSTFLAAVDKAPTAQAASADSIPLAAGPVTLILRLAGYVSGG